MPAPAPAPVTVDDYIGAQPAAAQPRLRELRAIIRSAVPEAAEEISYGMPTYKLAGTAVTHFAAAKRHCALYGAVPAEFGGELRQRGLDASKGTIRFPLDEPIPEDLVRRLVVARVAERQRQTAPPQA